MNVHVRAWFAALMPLIFLGSGCGHHIPATKPSTPPVISAVPTFTAMDREQPRAPMSQLPIRIKTDLTVVQTAIRKAIPERFTEAGHPLEKGYRWTFIRNGDPQVQIQDGLVAIHAEYKRDIEKREGPGACHLNPVYSSLDATGKIVLKQERGRVALVFEPAQMNAGLKPESDGRCAPFNNPLNSQLPELFAFPEIRTALAESVQGETFAMPFQRLWDDLEGPLSLPVASLNTKACLYGNPREVSLGPQTGTTQDTTIAGVAKQMPVLTLEQSCTEVPPTVALVNPEAVPVDNKSFAILAKIPISYTVFGLQLQSKLFHQAIALNPSSSDTALIERVSASDANGRVLLKVETTGDLTGTMYYWGTPHLDDGGRSLSIPDLQMANESKMALDSLRVGYWQVLDRELKNRLRQASTVELSSQLDRMKQAVMGTHNSGNLTLNVLVTNQQPDQAQSTAQGLVATILLQGTASVTDRMTVVETGSRAALTPPLR